MSRDNLNDGRPAAIHSRRSFLGIGAAAAAAALYSIGRPQTAEAYGNPKKPKDVKIVLFSDTGQRLQVAVMPMVVKTDEEWRQQLGQAAFQVARRAGTEYPYTGKYWNNHEAGLYRCICCNTALYSSATKYDSGTGWPSFWQPIARDNIVESFDGTLGMQRTAISCRLCEAHLGHVFDDGPKPTGLRYCMNSVALSFVKFA